MDNSKIENLQAENALLKSILKFDDWKFRAEENLLKWLDNNAEGIILSNDEKKEFLNGCPWYNINDFEDIVENALEDHFNMYIQHENLHDDASIILEEIIEKRKKIY